MSSIRFFTNAEVAATLAYPALIEALRQGLAQPAEAPVRVCHALPQDASLLCMPVWRAGQGVGVKLVTVFPGNGAQGLPAVAAVFALFDDVTGQPLALLEASELTARRTACTSALAADHLVRADAERLLVVGTGTLARHMVRAHVCVRGYRRIELWGRDAGKAAALATALRDEGYPVQAVGDLASAVATADCISCVTTSREPLVRGEWLRPGTHLDLVGAFLPSMRETDSAAVGHARVVVDTRGSRRPAVRHGRRRLRRRPPRHRAARPARRTRRPTRCHGDHPVQVGGLRPGRPGGRASAAGQRLSQALHQPPGGVTANAIGGWKKRHPRRTEPVRRMR
jgi:ornithine cyclodeaminase